jgi:hypothetical protein
MMQPDNLNEETKEIRLDFGNHANLVPIEGEPNHYYAFPKARRGKPFSSLVGHFNPVSNFGVDPDETLAMLQKVADYRLSEEQKEIARESGLALLSSKILSGGAEITILDLVKLWEHSPELDGFAKALRKNMLPS